MGHYKQAIEAYDESLQIKPDDGDISCLKGSALSALGRREEAIATYKRALEIYNKIKPPHVVFAEAALVLLK